MATSGKKKTTRRAKAPTAAKPARKTPPAKKTTARNKTRKISKRVAETRELVVRAERLVEKTRRIPKPKPQEPQEPRTEEPQIQEPQLKILPPEQDTQSPFRSQEDWVTVTYEGQGMAIHDEAGVFTPGTTTRLRRRVAEDLAHRDGFRVFLRAG
jgi:hypothetical protein